MKPFLSMVLLAFTLAACNRQPRPLPATDFAKAYAEAVCQQAARCQLQASHLEKLCQEEKLKLISAEDITRGVAAQRLVYDEKAARACLDGILATDCFAQNFDDDTLASCFAAAKGTVPPGGACQGYLECAAGFCGGEYGLTCPATCPEVLSEGADCAPRFGPLCDTRLGLRCSGFKCVKPGSMGQACLDNDGCHSGLICVPTGAEDGSGTCALQRKKGEPCSSDAACQPGLYCQPVSRREGKCEPRVPENGLCGQTPETVDAALRLAECQEGLVCRGTGYTSEGAPLPGLCVKPSGLLESCVSDQPGFSYQLNGCKGGLLCPSGVCSLPPSKGLCSSGGECLQGVSFCSDEGQCQPLKAQGEACRLSFECLSHFCGDDKCTDEVTLCHEP